MKKMMNTIFAALIIAACLWGMASGSAGETASAVLQSGIATAELMMTVGGGMVLWSGIMSIAEKAGLTDILAGLIRPLLRKIMPGLTKGSEAEKYVCMNVTANLLGLGNAATPPGIRAMQALAKQNPLKDGNPSRDMVTFAVLNTASVQIIPATVMTLRSAAGSADPAGIMPCVWLTSLCALAAGMIVCGIAGRGSVRQIGINKKGKRAAPNQRTK